MTHVLDPLIRYLDQKPTEGCACKICEGCREGLRILRAEREGARAAELRAEGRREERERVVANLSALARAAARSCGSVGKVIAGALEGAAECTERGDHWRGG